MDLELPPNARLDNSHGPRMIGLSYGMSFQKNLQMLLAIDLEARMRSEGVCNGWNMNSG